MSTEAKVVHIEKYDMNTFEKERKPYVMICTDVVQRMSMKNSQAFLIWVYLESLPTTWKPNKQHLINHFCISEKTYKRHMCWLNSVGLIEYRQNRTEKGGFGKGHLVVLNGTKFNPQSEKNGAVKIDPSVIAKQKDKVIHSPVSSRRPKNGPTEKTSTARENRGLEGISPEGQKTVLPCFDPLIKKTKSFKKEKEKTNNSVLVFSDQQTVKSHIQQLAAQRQEVVEAETISQGAYYAFDTNEDKSTSSVVKRINIFLKKVREAKWLIPQGYNNITSQSIGEKEEQYQEAKEATYAQDKAAYRSLAEAPGFQDMLKKLKGRANVNGPRVQTNAC